MSPVRSVLRRLRGGGPGGRSAERGNAIIEFGFLAVLFMVPLVYLMLGVFELQKAMYAASSAARDAGRAYSLQDSVAAAESRARAAATYAFQDQQLEGFNPNSNQLRIACDPPGGCLQPGSAVVVTVHYDVTLPFAGFLGDVSPEIPVESTHITPYGEYRQGGG